MNRQQVPVTLPRARFDIDPDGRLAVTVDGVPWQPPPQAEDTTATGLGMPLGRSDVPWAQQQIANDVGTPVLVEIVDGGQPYNDFVVPDGYQLAEPGRPEAPAAADVGRYKPGEPVVISVVVDRTHADEHGHVRYRLPAALGDRSVLVHGEASGTTLPLDLAPVLRRPRNAVETPSRPLPSPKTHDRDIGQRQSGSRHIPQPFRPGPQMTPDDGLGAL